MVNLRIIISIFSIFSLISSASAACTNNCPILEEDLCEKCSCGPDSATNQWTINCKNRGLQQVPTFTTSQYLFEVLTLADNQITSIPADKFKDLTSLKSFELTGNSISSVNVQAFSGLGGTLEELLLEVNGITTLPKDALSVLASLEKLELSGFDLSSSGLPVDAFANLNELSELHLANNKLSAFGDSILTGQQTSLNILNLDENLLSSIPTSALSKLQSLEFFSLVANTNLKAIGANAFQGSGLIHLDLSQNGINSLHPNAFDGLTLQNLTMRACQLTDSMLPAIQKMSSVQDLELSQNNLANIPANFFAQFNDLKILNFHMCNIHTLRGDMFAGLSNLEELDLSSNGLNSVASDTFTNTKSLVSLNLGSNDGLASQLNYDVFQSIATTLEVIDLQRTNFEENHWALLDNVDNLRSLTLSNNVVQNLPDLVLRNKKNLESLYLDQNRLSELKQEGLHGPNDNLEFLNLNDNNINTVEECVFHEFTSFNFFQLNLNANPLHCDCKMAWLLEILQQDPNYEFEKYSLNWVCATPTNLAGKKFAQELSLDDLVCDPPVTSGPCLDLSPSTTTLPGSTSTSPTDSPIKMNISHVSDVSFHVVWVVEDTEDLSGFRIDHRQVPDGEVVYREYDAAARSAVISGLTPETEYIVCILALGMSWPIRTQCENIVMMPPAGEVRDPKDNTLSIALGCSLGVLVIIAIIIIVVMVKRKQRNKMKKAQSNSYVNNLGVRIGGDSKRFSKPASKLGDTAYFQNKSNAAFENSLEGFSREERDRILGLVSQNGASTLSMLSNASSHRYVRDLPAVPGAGASGTFYLNPAMAGDDVDKHVYCEIPGESNYHEIPDSFI